MSSQEVLVVASVLILVGCCSIKNSTDFYNNTLIKIQTVTAIIELSGFSLGGGGGLCGLDVSC